ncbi:MAG: hypothetical protein NT075_15725 [Chloroflexi bacterium]|nr:hypothetical protein [Chloroflexota bacterium]
MAKAAENSVFNTGAKAQEIVIGVHPMNMGARIQILDAQLPETKEPRLEGRFIVLEAGSGKYKEAFEQFINKEIDAEQFIQQSRDYYHNKGLGEKFTKITHPINKGGLQRAELED